MMAVLGTGFNSQAYILVKEACKKQINESNI